MKRIFNERSNSHLSHLISHFSSGISLIALIITIIVIIILAAIVIFSGLNTPDRANLAKFMQNISDFRLAVQNDFMSKKAEYATNGVSRSDAQIYYIIANGGGEGVITNIDEQPNGTSGQYPNTYSLASLGLNNSGIEGTYAFYIHDDTYVKNWTKHTTYYEQGETHWITDKGDVFIMKGYRVEEDGNENYYLNEKAKVNTEVTNPEIVETIGMKNVEVGDYVQYSGNGSYTLYQTKTGITDAQATAEGYIDGKRTITPDDSITWRVWAKKEDGTIVIVPTATVSVFRMRGAEGFVHSLENIEGVCDAYTNSTLRVTADQVRSMKIEDLEDTNISNLLVCRDNFIFSSGTFSVRWGQTNQDINGDGFTSDSFYTAEDGLTILSTPRVGSDTNKVIVTNTYYHAFQNSGNSINLTWQPCGNTKAGLESDTYGSILGDTYGFLASPCVFFLNSDSISFMVRMHCNNLVAGAGLYSGGGGVANSMGVRPLVSLSPTLKYAGGDGASEGSAWQVTR